MSAIAEIADADRAAIDAFIERVWSQDGLANLTLEAYRSDLEHTAVWLRRRGGSLIQATHENLLRYLGERGAAKITARSNARLLTVLRRFYADYARTRSGFADPTLLLDPPKLPRSLPKALSEREIEALIAAPNVETPLGLRDRAMLELMYASGLRVSELTTLPIAALNLRQGVLRVTGKGGKDRLVPVGENALDWVGRYLKEARPALAKGRTPDALVPFQPRRGHDPPDGLDDGAQARRRRGHPREEDFSARAAAFLRHPPAQPRRRPARAADAARPQHALHHPDLHPDRQGRPQAAARGASSTRVSEQRAKSRQCDDLPSRPICTLQPLCGPATHHVHCLAALT